MELAKLHKYNELNEGELLQAVYSGDDSAAVSLLVDRCGPKLKFLAECKYAKLRLQFDELVSEVYLRLKKDDWKALRSFRGGYPEQGGCRLETYISVIASRLLWKKMDRAVKEIEWEATPIEMDRLNVEQAAFEPAIDTAGLADAILKLENPLDRELLRLYKLEGRGAQEVGEMLGMSPGNVYTRCNRALKMLRATLEERGRHE